MSDLLGLIGTLPHHIAPQLTSELARRVMAAFESGDERAMPAADPDTLRAFLDATVGRFLLFDG